MKIWKIDLFEVIYLFISIATFYHSMWGASFVFEGAMPNKTD